jgi:uncharacterized protein (TIGR02271 family)
MAERHSFAATFSNKNDVLSCIRDMEAQGIRDDDIYVFLPPGMRAEEFERWTGVEGRSTGESFWDKLGSFFTGGTTSLSGFDMPDEERRYLEECRDRGEYVVAVKCGDMCPTIHPLVTQYGGRMPASAGYEYREGYGYTDTTREDYTGTTREGYADPEREGYYGRDSADRGWREEDRTGRIPIHEERLRAEKTAREAGEVRVDKEVVEEERTMRVPVTHEEVEIERHAVDRPAEGDMGSDTVRIPVYEEDVRVTKEPRVVEEIEIKKRQVVDEKEIKADVRKEVPHIDEDVDRDYDDRRAQDY